MSSLKRHFTVVMNSNEHGLYVSSTPSSAARKAVSKLCADNKNKKFEFSIRETTQGSSKKIYGPYLGYMQKLDKPIELKGRVIRYKPIAKLKKKSRKMKGGTIDEELQKLVEEESFFIAEKILNYLNTTWNRGKPFLFISLGASPAYTFTALDTLLKKTDLKDSIVEIPLSGMSMIYTDRQTIPKNDKKHDFDQYISQFIRRYKESHDFIIIDHCHTCKSIEAFIKLLREIGFSNRIMYVNLVDIVTHDSFIHKPTNIDGYLSIKTKTLNLISGHKIPRAVPQYLFWHDLGKPVNYSRISQDAIKLRKRVEDYTKEKINIKKTQNFNNYMRKRQSNLPQDANYV